MRGRKFGQASRHACSCSQVRFHRPPSPPPAIFLVGPSPFHGAASPTADRRAYGSVYGSRRLCLLTKGRDLACGPSIPIACLGRSSSATRHLNGLCEVLGRDVELHHLRGPAIMPSCSQLHPTPLRSRFPRALQPKGIITNHAAHALAHSKQTTSPSPSQPKPSAHYTHLEPFLLKEDLDNDRQNARHRRVRLRRRAREGKEGD